MGALLGIALHAVGGFAAGSFYIPLKRVRGWAWESGWLVSGVAAWILLPLTVALLTVPGTLAVLGRSMEDQPVAASYTFMFGLLWGIGGLTFGLSIRYLGVALGTTVALGFSTAFGTLIPPLVEGRLLQSFASAGGGLVLLGLLICGTGMALAGVAGKRREDLLTGANAAAPQANYTRGLLVATFSGVLSACFAFGLAAGGELANMAIAQGTPPLFQNSTVLVILLWGGFITNAVWCLLMNYRNRTFEDYTAAYSGRQMGNFAWAALAGSIWYFQFMFYGMGSSYLGPAYEFASWSIHMAFIIFFSNLWGLYFQEWAAVDGVTRRLLYLALTLLVISVVLIGVGSNT